MVDNDQPDSSRQGYGAYPTRRKTIASLGAGGLLALAGCASLGNGGDGGDGGDGSDGGGDGDDGGDGGDGGDGSDGGGGGDGGGGSETVDLTIMTAQKETSAYALSQGIAAVINKNSDRLNVTAKPSEGGLQSMALMNKGEVDFAYTEQRNAYQIQNDLAQYENNPFDITVQQLFHFYDVQGTWTSKSREVAETVKDFAGKRIAWAQTGGPFHQNLKAALDLAGVVDQVDGVSMSYDQEPSALKEGRIKAATQIRLNADIVPGYEEQQQSLNPDQWFVVWPDDVVETINNDEAITGSIYGRDEIGGTEAYGDVDERFWIDVVYNLYSTKNHDPEIVYEFMKTLYDNGDALAEYNAVAEDWNESGFEFWTGNHADWMPWHQGAKQFYDEVGIEY